MKRIVIIGNGYPAGKAVRRAGRIHPKADIVWISDFDEDKYSLYMLNMLLNSGARVDDWSRIRARIKVDFEKYQQNIKLFPQKVKKIRITPEESEISFLTSMGNTSYSFDKVLIFTPKVVAHPENLPDDQHVWPGDSCVQHLVNNWENIQDPVVVGSDMSLVQALVRGEKEFVWVRTGNAFSKQVQFFMDNHLERLGVRIVPAGPDTDTAEILKKEAGQGIRPVFSCGHCRTDHTRLEGYGLKEEDTSFQGPDNPYARNVVLIDASGAADAYCLGFSPETQLARSLKMVEAALENGEYSPGSQDTIFWNLGFLSAAKTGLDAAGAQQIGYVPEFALIHGSHGMSMDKPYVLNMVMDKSARKIIGLEAVGEKAHEWVNLAACLARKGSTVEDISDYDIVWPDLVINPFTRCAKMLENKSLPGIVGITPDELKESANDGAVFYLLDVRNKDEFARGRLPWASNIPLSQLKKRVMEIPRLTPIVLYSECSGRAYEAARLLKGMGARQLYVLDGGYGLYTLDRDLAPLSPEQSGAGGTCPGC